MSFLLKEQCVKRHAVPFIGTVCQKGCQSIKRKSIQFAKKEKIHEMLFQNKEQGAVCSETNIQGMLVCA
jgi:hypothetical protein